MQHLKLAKNIVISLSVAENKMHAEKKQKRTTQKERMKEWKKECCNKMITNDDDGGRIRRKQLLTSKKCGRKRPIEYLAMSVVSVFTAAPKASTWMCWYAFVIHVGMLHPNTCNLIFAGILFNFDWIISVADIYKFKKNEKNETNKNVFSLEFCFSMFYAKKKCLKCHLTEREKENTKKYAQNELSAKCSAIIGWSLTFCILL